MAKLPVVTIAVPSYNQGRFLQDALTSVFDQGLPVEVFVADAGSTDGSVEVIKTFESRLAGWRSHPDRGQAAAINEGIAKCLGANATATTLPKTAAAPTVASPKTMPVIALCTGRKPSARRIAYCRRRSA